MVNDGFLHGFLHGFFHGTLGRSSHEPKVVSNWGENPCLYIQCGAPKITKLVYNPNNYGLSYL